MNPQKATLMERRRRVLMPCVRNFYKDPPELVKGEGVWLEDRCGRRYLDLFSGVSVNALGHARQEIVEAVRDQAGLLGNLTTIYLTEPMVDLAEELVALEPGWMDRVFFCASGSEANESAVFFGQQASGRQGVAAFRYGLHGNTRATLSLTGIDFWKGYVDPAPGVIHGESGYCFRCPKGKRVESCQVDCLDDLVKHLTEARGAIGTLILEVIQGNGGIIVPPAKYFQRIQRIVRDFKLVFIVDEVQTGFGRTGEMFACRHFGLNPDMITVAKALGGGLPMGAVMMKEAISESFAFPRASTFGGNPIVCRAGLAFLKVLREEGWVDRVRTTGEWLLARLKPMCEGAWGVKGVGDVRGKGLMIGIELVREGMEPDAERADRVMEEMLSKGFLLGRGGAFRNVLIFQPPYGIEQGELEGAVKALEGVLKDL